MSARRRFMLECGRTAAALLMMACRADRLMLPACDRDNPAPPDPAPARELRDVYIVDGSTALQLGTKENPYSVRGAAEFDALLAFLRPTDDLALHFAGMFKTAGVYRWGQYASRNLGRGWTVDGDAEIALDPDAITAIDGQPLYCLAGPASRVSGVSTRGSHSVLADRFPASLRTGGVLLEGDGEIDDVKFWDFGSKTDESFVGIVTGGSGRAAITNCLFDGYDPTKSNTQVTVFSIMGADDRSAPRRPFVLMEGNRTIASGDNHVQAHTIYDADSGLVGRNYSDGARIGYYVDYWISKGIKIVGNRFGGWCEHGVQVRLSPTPLPIAEDFSHEDYEIGENDIQSWGANVSLDTMGPSTSTRFIRNFSVHPSLSLENSGAENVTRSECRMAA